MNPTKIVRLLAVAVAVIAAFVAIPQAGLIMLAIGLVLGFIGVEEERRLMFLVIAVALSGLTGTLDGIPVVGAYLTAILSNLSTIINAAALAVILTGIKEKLME